MSEGRREPAFAFDPYLCALDDAQEPELAYREGQDFAVWRERLLAKVRDLLGPLPERAPLDAVILESTEFPEYVQHRVVYRTAPGVDAPAYLLVPAGVSAARPAPAVLALHGHGDGKDQVVSRDPGGNIYHSFGRRYAERGFVVLAPDAVGFGERSVGFRRYGDRDGCNVNFLKLALLGLNLTALNVSDDMRALDYLESRPEVAATRIGCAGLSFGGTRTMYLTALDQRVRAAVVSGYLTTFRVYALDMGNFCGSQFLPGVYAYADVPDLHGLIAPRPLLIEAGRADPGFPIAASREAYARLEQIFAAAGVPERLARDEFEGEHEFHAVASLDFMDRWLRQAAPG